MQRKRIFGSSSSPYGYLFLIVFLCSMFFTEIGFRTSNYGSRFFLTKAIVNHGTFRIDFQYPRLGTDYSLYQGHYFCDKPPGSSLMMIPQYILIGKPVEMLLDAVEPDELWRERFVAWVVQIFSISLYSALAVVGLCRIFESMGMNERTFSLGLLCFFGTLMFPYSTVGTGAMFTMPLIVWGLFFLLKNDCSKKDLFYGGLLFGLGCLTTNQVLFLSAAAGVFVLWRRRERPLELFFFAGPLIVFGIVILLYNWINFDSILSFPVKYWRGGAAANDLGGGAIQPVWFEFPSLYKVIDFLVLPSKGLFLYSPFLIFAIPGFKKMLKTQPVDVVCFLVLSFLIYFCFFLFVGLAGAGGPGGGTGFGFRYIIPALPFLCIGAAAWMSDRKLNFIEIAMIATSICLCSAGAIFGYKTNLTDYDLSFLRSVPTNNFITYYLWKRYAIDHWLIRLITTALFFGLIGALLWKCRASLSMREPSENR